MGKSKKKLKNTLFFLYFYFFFLLLYPNRQLPTFCNEGNIVKKPMEKSEKEILLQKFAEVNRKLKLATEQLDIAIRKLKE